MLTQPPDNTNFAGHLFRLASGKNLVECLRSSSLEVNIFEYPEGHWKYLWYSSDEDLLNETRTQARKQARASPDSTYDYPFLLRESEDRFILLSLDEVLVARLAKDLRLFRSLEKPKIDIGRLVRDLVTPPKSEDGKDTGREYLMGVVWAAVDGYGRALRRMSFIGDDLAEAQLFSSTLKSVSPFRVVLRDVKNDLEVVSIGSNGELSIYYRGMQHLLALDNLLRYLTRRGYIVW